MPDANTITILAANLDAARAKLATLDKRRARLAAKHTLTDAAPISLDVVRTYTEKRADVDGRKYLIELADVTVTGTTPRIAGWEIVAVLEHTDAGNIVRTIPTAELAEGELVRFRNVRPHCEHCNHKRYRKDTYIVRDTAGDTRQVGRTCLSAYTGGLSPAAAIAMARVLLAVGGELDDAAGMGYGGCSDYYGAGVLEFLAAVALSIRLYGWTSRTAARDAFPPQEATADHVWGALYPTNHPAPQKAAREFFAKLTDADKSAAADALAKSSELGDSDYEHNLRVAIGGEIITHRTAGIAASLITWYERAMGREVARKARAKRAANSEHIGAVKERLTVDVTIESIHDCESDWGTTHIHKMIDSAGNALTWFSSSKRLTVGQAYTMKATVKKHDEYRGEKQTVVTRCKQVAA